MMSFEDHNLPALFIAADDLSKRSQKEYINSMRRTIVLLAASSLLGSVAFSDFESKKWAAVATAITTSLSLFFITKIESEKKDRDWYDGRAVAESVKTKAWRFMLHSDPYSLGLGENSARTSFLDSIKEIREQRSDFIAKINPSLASRPQITDEMVRIRKMDFEARKRIYLDNRIKDQITWYTSKAESNKKYTDSWFRIIICFQVASIIGSILMVVFPDSSINLVGIFAGFASSAIAWLQLKRHQELSNSYSLAAQELGLILEQGNSITAENDFPKFVSDAETAISREHTLWAARRDTN